MLPGLEMSKRRAESETEGSSHVSKAEEDAITKAQESMGREWFAITAFPLFAGTFGPIASALNICALVMPWRCEYASTELQNDAKDITDPPWLIAINVISLVFGLAANIAVTFVGRSRLASPARYGFYLGLITVICGGLASFILIALVIAVSMMLRLPSPPEHAFTEAYYYAIMAAALYLITSTFVVYTAYIFWETRKTAQGRRELSKQSLGGHGSLKLLTMAFMAYLLIGAAVFSRIEGWRYLDGVFWADVTILTVGFGDFTPVTHLGQSLLIPYALFGVFILVWVIYCITQVVFERGKSMWEVRIRDQERLRRIREREGLGRRRRRSRSSNRGSGSSSGSNDGFNQSNSGQISSTVGHKKMSKKQRIDAERAARERDFFTMRSILLKSNRKRIQYSMGLWLGFSIFLWFFGALLFYISERDKGWSYFKSLYFTFISILTIGYGDDTLHSMSGKAIFVLWSLIVVPTLTMLISTGTEAIGVPYLTGMQRSLRKRLLGRDEKEGVNIEKRLSLSSIPPNELPHNTHDKNHLLICAIKTIARDHIQNQTSISRPEYSFEDWEYMFYLMDVLEPVSDDEATAQHANTANEEKAKNEREEVENKREDGKGEGKKKRKTGIEEWQDGSQIPDWLHGKNPLNVSGESSLTEWMLLVLVEKLESELADLRRKEGNVVMDE